MRPNYALSRRNFLAAAAAAPLAFAAPAGKAIPVGLEMFSVRGELNKDLPGTVKAVGKMGYQVVEFFSPYASWSADQARGIRKIMDDLGIRCNSTHNDIRSFTPEALPKVIELNKILGSRFLVMASAGRPEGLEGWKRVADRLASSMDTLRPAGMRAGYHNHQTEFTPIDGHRPMEVLASNTPKDVMLQLDVGTCIEVGSDPVAWIRANPGRINCLHCKDWAPSSSTGPDHGYRVLFGEGVSPWPAIFEAAESVGGVEYYLIEQEGSRFPEFETAERCLATWHKMRG